MFFCTFYAIMHISYFKVTMLICIRQKTWTLYRHRNCYRAKFNLYVAHRVMCLKQTTILCVCPWFIEWYIILLTCQCWYVCLYILRYSYDTVIDTFCNDLFLSSLNFPVCQICLTTLILILKGEMQQQREEAR